MRHVHILMKFPIRRVSFLSCLVASLCLAVGQDVTPLDPSAPAVVTPAAGAVQNLESGSFEWPPVVARKLRTEGADISKSAMNIEWIRFKDKPDPEGGRLLFGLTNEIFRSGRQCLFVEFDKVTKPMVVAELSSTLLPVVPGEPYRVAIWGRMDKKRPITLDQRLPYLKLRVDWFKIDEENEEAQTGEVVWKAQPIPGPLRRPPLFVSTRWSEYWADVKAPDDAHFIKITWTWETSPHEGETNGVIYFDDAVLVGKAAPRVNPLDEIEMEEKQAEEAAAKAEEAAKAAGRVVPKPDAAKPSAAPAPEPKAPKAPEKPAGKKEPRIEAIPLQ